MMHSRSFQCFDSLFLFHWVKAWIWCIIPFCSSDLSDSKPRLKRFASSRSRVVSLLLIFHGLSVVSWDSISQRNRDHKKEEEDLCLCPLVSSPQLGEDQRKAQQKRPASLSAAVWISFVGGRCMALLWQPAGSPIDGTCGSRRAKNDRRDG